MESIRTPEIVKQGVLGKLGGGAGGHKNWKDRYFVLSDHLYYFASKEAYSKEPKAPLGRIVLNSYFCAKTEDSSNYEFTVNAYPKSLNLRAHSSSEMEEWIQAMMSPLQDLAKVPM